MLALRRCRSRRTLGASFTALGTRKVRIAIMGLIDERLERDRRIVGREPVRRRRARYQRTFTNAAPNFFREFLSIRFALCVIRFGRVSQEAAFHQHRRNGCFSQDVKAAASDAAIRAGCATGHVIMNRGSERQTLRTIKVSFDTARAPPTRGIEVDTNEDRVPIGIGDRNARPQWHEDVTEDARCDRQFLSERDLRAAGRRPKSWFFPRRADREFRRDRIHHGQRRSPPLWRDGQLRRRLLPFVALREWELLAARPRVFLARRESLEQVNRKRPWRRTGRRRANSKNIFAFLNRPSVRWAVALKVLERCRALLA